MTTSRSADHLLTGTWTRPEVIPAKRRKTDGGWVIDYRPEGTAASQLTHGADLGWSSKGAYGELVRMQWHPVTSWASCPAAGGIAASPRRCSCV